MKKMAVERFAASFQAFLENVNELAPEKDEKRRAPVLAPRIAEFLGEPAHALAIARSSLLLRDLPNIQLAMDELLSGRGWAGTVVGYTVEHDLDFGLATVLKEADWQTVREGPLAYRSISLPTGPLRCLERGLRLLESPRGRAVVLIHTQRERYNPGLHMDVAAASADVAEGTLAEIEQVARSHDVLRGAVFSLTGENDIQFHALAPVLEDELILPERLLDTIHRTTVEFSRHQRALLAANRHLKRGVLLHGAPGTGKSLTLRYLVGQMPGRTTLVLTGRVQGLIKPSCELARMLAPSTVILEDVDLIAEDRTRENQCGPLLFDLMNEMDGLPGDADVLFLLTTNRPDILEPALASRPGRIDQAIELPLPDEECRVRLITLYGQGLEIEPDDASRLARKTEGVSPAFIRELLRRAAVNSAQGRDGSAGGRMAVSAEDLDRALEELLVSGGALTGRLLGVAPAA